MGIILTRSLPERMGVKSNVSNISEDISVSLPNPLKATRREYQSFQFNWRWATFNVKAIWWKGMLCSFPCITHAHFPVYLIMYNCPTNR